LAVLGTETLLLGGRDFVVCLQRDTGREQWRHNMEVEPAVNPVQSGGNWLLAGPSGAVSALDAAAGQMAWAKEFSAPIKFLVGNEKHVVVVESDATVSLLKSATGEILWQKKSSAPIALPPILAATDVCIVAHDKNLMGYRIEDGATVWHREIGPKPIESLASGSNDIFAVMWDHAIWSLNAQTGDLRWTSSPGDALLLSGTAVQVLAVTDPHLLVYSHRGRLSALSRATGELRAISDFKYSPGVPCLIEPEAVILVKEEKGRSLVAFDAQTEIVFDLTNLPVDSTVLGGEGAQLLLLNGSGELALANVRYRPPNPHMEMFSDNRKLWSDLVPAIGISVTLVVGAIIFAAAGRARIPSTQMTSLLLLALLICVVALCVISARMGWLILTQATPRSLPAMSAAAALFGPAICLLVGHLAVWWRVLRLGGSNGSAMSNPESRKVIRRLVRDMDLPADTVNRVVEANDGPSVLGLSRRRFKILLPRDLDERALRACGGDPQSAGCLLRLVMAHELAHVRNGDVWFIPLLTSIRRIFPWCLGIIVISSFLAEALAARERAILLTRVLVGMMALGGVSLWVLLKLALHERERLADATATLFVSPESVARLVQSTADCGTTPPRLGAFLLGLRLRLTNRRRFLGFDAALDEKDRLWRHWLTLLVRKSNTIAEFQRELAARSDALRQKRHAVGRFFDSNWQAVVPAGIVAGLLLAAFAHFVVADFFACLLQFGGGTGDAVAAGFLEAYRIWTHEQDQSLGWNVARTLAPLVAGMLLAGTAFLPWRDAARQVGSASHHALNSGLKALLLALIVAAVVFELTAPSRFPFPSFPRLQVSASGLWLSSAAAALLFAPLLVIRSLTGHTRQILLEALLVLLLVAAGGLVCFCLLKGLSTVGRLVWTLALILIPSLLLLAGPFRWLMADEDYREESIRCVRVFGFSRVFCNRLGGEVGLTRQSLLWFSLHAVSVFCLPGLLLAVPVRHALLEWDTQRFKLFRLRNIELAQFIEEAPNRLQVSRTEVAGQLLPLWAERSIYDPAGARPSTWLGMGALSIGSVLGLGVAGSSALVVRRKAKQALASAGAMAELFERLELPLAQSRFSLRLREALNGIDSYLTGKTRTPLLTRTCRVLECAACLRLGGERQLEMLAWVLKCQLPSGGFGLGQAATLQHTVAALRTLRRSNPSGGFTPSLHERWLRQILAECWRKRLALAPPRWLEAVGLTLEGLEQIEGGAQKLARLKRLGRGFVETALRSWQLSGRSPQNARCLAKVFSAWRPLASSACTEFQQAWLSAWERKLATLHPETRLKELADSVVLLSDLFPVSWARRASVVQIADNLEKYWRAA
jgi:hypothetical protein